MKSTHIAIGAVIAAIAIIGVAFYPYYGWHAANYLCRNYRGGWLEQNGILACYRAP